MSSKKLVTIPAYRYSTMSLSRKLRFVLSFYGLMAEVRVEPYKAPQVFRNFAVQTNTGGNERSNVNNEY
jgi:hypothetical protein